MPDLVIEAGKFYRTRNGIKAVVYAVYPNQFWEILGALYFNNGWNSHAWRRNGQALTGSIPYDHDLISPWIDPPVVDWDKFPPWIVAVAKDSNGYWTAYLDVPIREESDRHWYYNQDSYSGGKVLYFASFGIRDDDAPTFSGDWRDSLAIRPGHEEEK